MPFSLNLQVKFNALLTKALSDTLATDPVDLEETYKITDGTGVNQADMMFHELLTISGGSTHIYDLSGDTTFVNAFGDAQDFARITTIAVLSPVTNSNDIHVVRPASNGTPLFLAAGDGIAIPPGGVFVFHVGQSTTKVPVTAATADLLHIINGAGGPSVLAQVILIGTSA